MLKRISILPVLIVLAAIALTLLATGFIEGFLFLTNIMHLQHALGFDTQTSHNYASASGTLPMVVTALGFSGLLVTALHHLNCHEPGCWRIARFSVAGGKFKTCKIHHPDPAVREGIKAHHILTAHQEYQDFVKGS